MMKQVGKWSLIASVILGLGILILWILGQYQYLAPLVVLFFVALATAFNAIQSLKGFSFTLLIFAAVAASLLGPSPARVHAV